MAERYGPETTVPDWRVGLVKETIMLSRNLEKSLHRALAHANDRRHEFATLEHLLLALTEDQEAIAVLRACGVDLDRLRREVLTYVDNELGNLVAAQKDDAKPTANFHRVLQRAAIHVQSSGREEVTGANVLVAMFAERESHAVYFLQEQDMTRADAVNYISHGIAKAPDSTGRQIEAPRPVISTTSLERAVIECLGQAEVIALIAGKLNISSSIVRGHIRNILWKVHVANSAVVAPATAPLPPSAASIEERLAFLHAGLKITDAQAAIWDPFAEEVRNSLDAIEVLRGGKGDGQPLMLPGKVAAREMDQLARLDAHRQLAAVIAPFYAGLSDRQKRTADVLLLTILGVM
jgi:DNA-binding CsgD family transcriptional regulator